MVHLTAHTLNDTWIVPAGAPDIYSPDQLDKLNFVGPFTLAWPAIIAGIIIFIQSSVRRWSYAPLAILWVWSVASFSLGTLAAIGRFAHLINFIGITHVQVEWFIIGLLLGLSGPESYILSTAVGTILYVVLLGAPGIKVTFLVTSVSGGFGDVLMPVLFFWGGQPILGLAGASHFINGAIVFFSFVQYIPIGLYFGLQIVVTTAFALFTVIGVLRLRKKKAAIRLEATEEYALGSTTEGEDNTPIIPVPNKATFIRLALFSLAISLAGSIPLNFAPR